MLVRKNKLFALEDAAIVVKRIIHSCIKCDVRYSLFYVNIIKFILYSLIDYSTKNDYRREQCEI